MKRKILAFCIALLLILNCTVTAFAEEPDLLKTGSICVTLTEQYEKTPIVGAELSVYFIAAAGINTDGNLNYVLNEDFAGLGFAVDDPELVSKLDAYLLDNEMPAIHLITDENGTASCENLPLGLYFIHQTNSVEDYAPCTPFLVTLPALTDDGYVYDVNAAPKTEVAKLTDITIKKVWNTDAYNKATDSVTINLLRGGQVVQTAVLNESNNWQVTYTDLPESDSYTVEEVDVPKGFTATYKQRGYVFTVTNTSTLIQTGQLIWPIPVLSFLGILLIGAGAMLLLKKRNRNA